MTPPLETQSTLEAIGHVAVQPVHWVAAIWPAVLDQNWKALTVIGGVFILGNVTWAALGERWQSFDRIDPIEHRIDTLEGENLQDHSDRDELRIRVGGLEGTIDELQPMIYRLFCDRFPEDCELGPMLRPR